MGVPVLAVDPRTKDLERYLIRIADLAISNLTEMNPEASKAERSGWKRIFEQWKPAMKVALHDWTRDDKSWRRIAFLLEECEYHIAEEETILNRNQTDVAPYMSPDVIVGLLKAKDHYRIHAWVDELDDSRSVVVTFHRLRRLEERVQAMKERMAEAAKPGFDEHALDIWSLGVETEMTPQLHVDAEWEKILYMLDDMMKRFDEGENLLDHSGKAISRYFTGEGMLKSLKMPYSRFKDFHPKTRSGDHGHLARSLNKGDGTSATSLSRRQQLRYGQSTAGGVRRLSI